jgi:hypothetical protein
MEYGIYILIAIGFSIAGGVAGALIGANNAKDVEKIIANAKAELARTQKKADELKAQLLAQGIKL